jgi:hypothetical protein
MTAPIFFASKMDEINEKDMIPAAIGDANA